MLIGIGFWEEYRWLQPGTQRTMEVFDLEKGCRRSVAPPAETALALWCYAHVHPFLHKDPRGSARRHALYCREDWTALGAIADE